MDHRVRGKGETDLSALLPDDVLADALRHLAPRDLVTSRCVCKAWRAIIDFHPLLRARLLPRSLAGILINFDSLDVTEFFYRPSTDRPVSGKHHYLPEETDTYSWSVISDHCNGLLLLHNYVLNPATRWSAPLPPAPAPRMGGKSYEVAHLVYDPTVSSHYEVFLVPRFYYKYEAYYGFCYKSYLETFDPEVEKLEWPPSPCILNVFSSKTGRWEERAFVREGPAPGTVAHMRSDYPYSKSNAVYWRGVLYVHCQTNFIMRISLSDDIFQVIKPPMGIEVEKHPELRLGKSEKGVYCALVYKQCRFRVWFLDESSYHQEWVLKADADLHEWVLKNDADLFEWVSKHKNIKSMVQCYKYKRQVCGPWILEDVNYYYDYSSEDEDMEAPLDKFEWDSEDEKLQWNSKNEGPVQRHFHGAYIDILGFHPFKEIIFLGESIERGLAYHLKSSKVEDLGNLYPKGYDEELPNERSIISSFPYTPCWMGQIVGKNNLEDHIES